MWIYTSIQSNKIKSACLFVSFPILLYIVCFIICLIVFKDSQVAKAQTNEIFIILWPIILIWWIISLIYQKQIIFKYTWAKDLDRKDNPRIYNIVENLCISKGIQTPHIGIIQDSSMNAFATWRDINNSWIVFTSWLINKLDDREIQAVAGHELTHLLNKDCRLMAIIVVYIWAITTIWQILLRTSWWSRNSKSSGLIPIIWLTCLILWYVFYPLIRLAISRKREFLADAWSVILTKDNQSMISALQKISTDSAVESIQRDTVAAMCIENPIPKIKKWLWNLLSTHPSIEDRIAALKSY